MTPTQKTTSTKAICLAVLVLSCMIVSPVCALEYRQIPTPLLAQQEIAFNDVSNISYDVLSTGKRISVVSIVAPENFSGEFTLNYGNGSTVSGTLESNTFAFMVEYAKVEIGGSSTEWWGPNVNPLNSPFFYVGYGSNSTDYNQTGLVVYGPADTFITMYPESNITQKLIYAVEISGDKQFDTTITIGDPETIIGSMPKDLLTIIAEWVDLAIQLAFFIKDVVFTLFAWIEFFFWDNLGMTVALYVSISMAYSANTAKDIFKFLGKFLNDQRKLFEFILSLWTTLVNLIATFRGIFRI